MRYYPLTILVFLFFVDGDIYAQSLFAGGTPFSKPHEEVEAILVEDTVAFYSDFVKMDGWMEGCGRKLTKEEASHCSSYLKFSKKNEAGHWTCVENYTGRGKLENNQLSTYLVNPFNSDDEGADETWRKKLKDVVRLELISDYTGMRCVEERAYDILGDLVYKFVLTPIGFNTVMGHYVDNDGTTAKMRSDDGAEFVIIERDSRGFETKISFVGQSGYFKRNKDGAFMERNTYDAKGNRLSLGSCDVDGKYMIDRTGNCGQRLVYNSMGDNVSVTNLDEKGEVMKNEEKGIDFYVKRSKFDRYGREIEGRYYLPNGEPDTLQSGIHGYRQKYNRYGECVLYMTFGLDGKPRNGDEGWAFLIREYNEEGKVSDLEIRDQDGLLCHDNAGLHDEYERGQLVEEVLYKSDDGVHKDEYDRYTHRGNMRERWIQESNSAWRQRYDAQGRVIETAYFDANEHPRCGEDGYHAMAYMHTSEGHISYEETKYLDTDSTLVSVEPPYNLSYNREVTMHDSLNHLQTNVYYEGDRMVSNDVLQYDSCGFATSQHSLDITGSMARTWYGNRLYYSASMGKNPKGNRTYIMAQNEYGEPAYVLARDSSSPLAWTYDFLGNNFFYTDDKGEDRRAQEIAQEARKACIVEIVDDKVDNHTLQSGDVIMKYGNWIYQYLSKNYSPDNELRLETFIKRNCPKEVVVMRHNLQQKRPEYLILQLPKGMPRDFGFTWHYFPYTDKEVKRYEETFARYRQDQHIMDTVKFSDINVDNGKKMVMVRISHVKAPSHEAYKKGMRNDAFVLGSMMIDEKGEVYTYLVADTTSLYEKCMTGDGIKTLWLWYTEDMNTVHCVEFDDNNSLGLYSSVVDVQDSLSDSLVCMAHTVREEMDSLIAPNCSAWSEEQKDSLYKLAKELWNINADNRAHRMFLRLGVAGYSKAYYNLSADYLLGFGVEKDIAQAERWESLSRKDSSYTATYYIARQYVRDNNKKKAKEYLGYLRKGNKPKWYNELMGQYYLQDGDTLKSLKYLNDYVYYLWAKDDSAKIIDLYEDYTDNYFKRYPKQSADGMAHLAYNIYDLEYYKEALSMFDEARSVRGDLKTGLMDYETTYYKILRDLSEKHPDEYGEKFRSYMTDKAFVITVAKGENQAREAGLKGSYYILSWNGWDILNTGDLFVESKKTNKDLILSDEEGNVNSYSFSGTIGITREIKVIGKRKKTLLEDAYRNYIKKVQNQ